MLSNLFATPTTLRYAAMAEGEDTKAAGNGGGNNDAIVQAAGSGTPSFLRRSNFGRYGGTVGGFSPTAVRKPQPFVGKGLSAIVQGLRDMEEERLQDDTDVLREIEAEKEAEQAAANVEVDDSQAQTTALQPTRKKKGQKRTTRRVTMRPVVVPRPTRQSQSKELDGESDDGAAVPETQHPETADEPEIDDTASLHSISEPDLGSDPDYGEEPTANNTKTKTFSEKIREAISSVAKPQPKPRQKSSQPTPTKHDEKKSRARKVNPEAHANYRALKIRNKNTKGRFGRRFGR